MTGTLAIGCPTVEGLVEVKGLAAKRLNAAIRLRELGCSVVEPRTSLYSVDGTKPTGATWRLRSDPGGVPLWFDADDFK